MRVRILLPIAALLGVLSAPVFGSGRTDGALAGRVLGAQAPVTTARVYAYEMAGLGLEKVATDRNGVFLFESLPAGLYKIIALKQGFLPSIVMLTRASAEATQFLEVELTPASTDPAEARASFWQIREQIPSDVLRDVELPALLAQPGDATRPAGLSLRTEMAATAGVHETPDAGDAQVNGARVGIEGRFRDVAIGFQGKFSELASQRFDDGPRPVGSSQALSLKVAAGGRAQVDVASRSNRLDTAVDETPGVDFALHRLSWSQAVGEHGRSDFSAQYTEESNYYRQAVIGPSWIPDATRSWRVEGSYSTRLGSRTSLEAGLRYRERESEYDSVVDHARLLPSESVELFSRGGVDVGQAVVVQYGLYSKLSDGSLSMAPQGGLVLRFGPHWRASTVASMRIDDREREFLPAEFTPTFFEDRGQCRSAELYCYGFEISRSLGGTELLSIGAVHRKVGETQRLYFDSDFLDRLDSLYLVEGDELPELRLELTRRLGPEVVARFRSYLAAGGGGLMQVEPAAVFENEVSYLVTSLDTRFEATSTGVYFAFHRLEQELNPLGEITARDAPELALERLQIGLSQDFGLSSLQAADLALNLEMELSRGTGTETALMILDKLRRRVTGGIAVRF